jgi:hypothetical protein
MGAHRAHTCGGRGAHALQAAQEVPRPSKRRSAAAAAAQPAPVVEAAPMSDAMRKKLTLLQNELKGTHTLPTIAAAKELLDGDGECDRNRLCAKHGITASPAAFERITAVVKQLGVLELPDGAVNLDDPDDAAMLGDVQLLLQTANGAGGHSRSACGTPPPSRAR